MKCRRGAMMLTVFAIAACTTLDDVSKRAMDVDHLAADAGPTPVSASNAFEVRREVSPEDFLTWSRLLEELAIAQLQESLNAEHRPQPTLIVNATIIDVRSAAVQPNTTLRLAGGRIQSIHKNGDQPSTADQRVIDAQGHFLTPGLVDMHVHGLTSSAQELLNIAHGVTTVRDMDGFPFLLAQRDQARRSERFAPTMVVTGTILNAFSMDWYAKVITTPTEARAAVRAQAAAGYDAIKIHNRMRPEVLRAVFEEAQAHDLDVVGHIPHELTVAEAVEMGLRTAEHFKGYILDSSLTPSPENWASATRGAEIWNAPTIIATNAHLYGDAALAALAVPETRLMSPLDLQFWREQANRSPQPATRLRLAARGHMEQIFRTLHAAGGRFLAGTDSGGGYPFLIYGRALIEELSVFQALGMTPAEALATATIEPAIAMRREGELGEITEGARADFVLLRANPLTDAMHLYSVEAVCIRGACLDRAQLDNLIARLGAVYVETSARLDRGVIQSVELQTWLADTKRLALGGYVFRDNQLALAAAGFEREGHDAAAKQVRALMTDPAFRLK